MELNKAVWSTEENHIRLSMPIQKVDKERRIVSGFATLDNVDKQGDIVPSEASLKAFSQFRGNLREMHQPIAVGKVVSFKEDKYFDQESKKFYNGVFVSAYVSKGAQDTWEKVLDGTLTGFSIGGNISKTDDVYDEKLDKPVRVIKEYQLSELSLVDNPANQFANVVSIEKGETTGYLSKASIENVYWCSSDDIVRISIDELANCPQCEKSMQNIGFVESNDEDKAEVVKSIISKIKKSNSPSIELNSYVFFKGDYGKVINIIEDGAVQLANTDTVLIAKTEDPIAIIRLYSEKDGTIVPTNRRVIKNVSTLETVNAINKSEVKEVSKMEDAHIESTSTDEVAKADVIVVDEVDSEVAEVATEINEEVTKASDNEEQEVSETEVSDEVTKSEEAVATETEDAEEIAKSEETSGEELQVAKSVADLNETLTSALSTLAETVNELNAKIESVAKSVSGVSQEVKEVKEKYDSFGKRVDAVEKDTAFRKSGDLGEIVQETPVIMEKSLWGGRFLTNADLFN